MDQHEYQFARILVHFIQIHHSLVNCCMILCICDDVLCCGRACFFVFNRILWIENRGWRDENCCELERSEAGMAEFRSIQLNLAGSRQVVITLCQYFDVYLHKSVHHTGTGGLCTTGASLFWWCHCSCVSFKTCSNKSVLLGRYLLPCLVKSGMLIVKVPALAIPTSNWFGRIYSHLFYHHLFTLKLCKKVTEGVKREWKREKDKGCKVANIERDNMTLMVDMTNTAPVVKTTTDAHRWVAHRALQAKVGLIIDSEDCRAQLDVCHGANPADRSLFSFYMLDHDWWVVLA